MAGSQQVWEVVHSGGKQDVDRKLTNSQTTERNVRSPSQRHFHSPLTEGPLLEVNGGPMKCAVLLAGCAWLSLSLAWAAPEPKEPELTAKDLPRAPFVPPDKAVGTIHVKPGFHVELVAAEPN